MSIDEAKILVVRAGSVGLTMSTELARHTIACRIIDNLRHSRVFFAGDATHIHSLDGYVGFHCQSAELELLLKHCG